MTEDSNPANKNPIYNVNIYGNAGAIGPGAQGTTHEGVPASGQPLLPIPSQPTNKSRAQWTEEGEAHRAAGRYSEALDCYEQALALDGRYLRALRGRAWALHHVNLLDALAAAEETLALYPKDAETHYLRGLLLREMGREEDALAALDEALKLYPRYEQARSARAEVVKAEIQRFMEEGDAQFNARRHDEAIAAYERVLRLDERNARAWFWKGYSLIVLGRRAEGLVTYERALKESEQALVQDERSLDAWFWKGNALLGLSRQEEGLAAFERAVELDERNPEAWYWKGRALSVLGRKEEAEQTNQRYWELHEQASEPPAQAAPQPPPQNQPTPAPAAPQKTIEEWLAEGQAHLNAYRLQESLAAFERALGLDDRSAEAWYWKGQALWALGFKAESLAAFERALGLNRRNADAWQGKGLALVALGRFAEALEAYERALVLDERKAAAWWGKGDALRRLGREVEAQQAWQRWWALSG